MADSYSFLDAKQQLENEMTDRQKRLINILTGQYRYESSAAEEELLETEIEDRKIALEKLEAQSCCDCCGTQVDVRETFRVRLTKYSEKLLTINLVMQMEKVRVSMECADCWRKYDSQQRPERIVATRDEIDQAIDILTPTELRKLQTWADKRVQHLGQFGCWRDGKDLFNDAVLSTLDGRKKWNRSAVDFVGHMLFAIKNISFCWKQKFNEREPSLESDIITRNAEGDEMSPLENIDSADPSVLASAPWLSRPAPAPDESLLEKEKHGRIFRTFAHDKEVSAVLQARLEGMTTAREIMQEHNLTKRQYEAAVKRIRCPKSVLVIEDYDQVLGLVVRWLKLMGYAVHTASNGDEGLRLYRECGLFDVVMISHSLKQNGVELAMDILKKNPLQRMIITTIYGSAEEVPRPSELMHIPILLKPFGKSEFRTVVQSFANPVREKPANCFRLKRRRAAAIRLRLPARRQRVKAAKAGENS
jgi:two-component system response regulator (stage 0 sporulation protein F)